MRILVISLIVLGVGISIPYAQSPSNARPTIANEADFRRALKELSNWGRWGDDDELGAANLITPAKRKQAVVHTGAAEDLVTANIGFGGNAADGPIMSCSARMNGRCRRASALWTVSLPYGRGPMRIPVGLRRNRTLS
jgi:hypothetical protein